MKKTTQLLGGLAAATLLLSSCGDEGTTRTESESSNPAASEEAYPLEVCVVSGEELGSMGEPVVVTHDGTEVRLCCDECLPKFNADPEKYTSMVKSGKVDHSDHNH